MTAPFDPALHPRSGIGRFAPVARSEADVDLTDHASELPTVADLLAHLGAMDPNERIGLDEITVFFDHHTDAFHAENAPVAEVVAFPVRPHPDPAIATARRFVDRATDPAAAEFARNGTVTIEGLRAWQDLHDSPLIAGTAEQAELAELMVTLRQRGWTGTVLSGSNSEHGGRLLSSTMRSDIHGRPCDGPNGEPAVAHFSDGEPAGHEHRIAGRLQDPADGSPAVVEIEDGVVTSTSRYTVGARSDGRNGEPAVVNFRSDGTVAGFESYSAGERRWAVAFDESGNIASASGPDGSEIPEAWWLNTADLAGRYPSLRFRQPPPA